METVPTFGSRWSYLTILVGAVVTGAIVAAYFAGNALIALRVCGLVMIVGAVVDLSIAAFLGHEGITPRTRWGIRAREYWVMNLGVLMVGVGMMFNGLGSRPMEWTYAIVASAVMFLGLVRRRRATA